MAISVQTDTNAVSRLIIDMGVMIECLHPLARPYTQICLVNSVGSLLLISKFVNSLEDNKLKHKTNAIYAAKEPCRTSICNLQEIIFCEIGLL